MSALQTEELDAAVRTLKKLCRAVFEQPVLQQPAAITLYQPRGLEEKFVRTSRARVATLPGFLFSDILERNCGAIVQYGGAYCIATPHTDKRGAKRRLYSPHTVDDYVKVWLADEAYACADSIRSTIKDVTDAIAALLPDTPIVRHDVAPATGSILVGSSMER